MARGSRVVSGIMRIFRRGASRMMVRTSDGSHSAAVASTIAMRKVFCARVTSKVSGVITASSSDSARRTVGHNSSARGVGLTPCAVRITSSSLSVSRSRRNAFDTAGWVIASKLAARVRFCSVITASNTRNRFRSRVRKLMSAAPHKAERKKEKSPRSKTPFTKGITDI